MCQRYVIKQMVNATAVHYWVMVHLAGLLSIQEAASFVLSNLPRASITKCSLRRLTFINWQRPIRESAQSTRISIEWHQQYKIIGPKLGRESLLLQDWPWKIKVPDYMYQDVSRVEELNVQTEINIVSVNLNCRTSYIPLLVTFYGQHSQL